jgi:hypothetical protein
MVENMIKQFQQGNEARARENGGEKNHLKTQ